MSRAQARPERLLVSPMGLRGLYAVTPDEPDTEVLKRKVRKALAGGARIVQYRNKSANAGLRLEQGAELLALCRKAGAPLIVNDDLDLALAARSAGADYVAFGSAFPSETKPGATLAPLGLYREAKALLDSPIVAIGGITPENAHAVIEAGADAVAVISALFGAPDIEAAARRFDLLFQKKAR